jgi:hypothetical protein
MKAKSEFFDDDESAKRRDEVVRRMANTPPQPKTSHPQGKKKKAVSGRAVRKGRARREV